MLRFSAVSDIAPRTTPTTFISPLCTNAAPVCLDFLENPYLAPWMPFIDPSILRELFDTSRNPA